MTAAPLILLTGGTGFVGRQIARELAARNYRVRFVVRKGSESRIQHSEGVESIVPTPDLWSESAAWHALLCKDVDTVIHAAWYAEPGQYLQSPKNADCLRGTLQLAQGAIDARLRRFVGIGTCFEYDLDQGRLSTQTALKPTSPYAEAKVAAFTALSQLLPPRRVSFAWCRLFYLYGEHEDGRRLVPYLRSKLAAGEPAELGTGKQIRDYLDVREAGRMIADTALGGTPGPVNICSSVPVTIREIAERIADEYGRRDLLHFGVRPEKLTDPPCVVGLR